MSPGIADDFWNRAYRRIGNLTIATTSTATDLDSYIQEGRDDLRTITRALDIDFIGKRVWEIGCGNGRMTIPIAEVASEVVANDVSILMLSDCKAYCGLLQRHHSDPQLLLGGVDVLKKREDRSFDIIFSYIVFQHLTRLEVRQYLDEISRLLSTCGTAYLQLRRPGAWYRFLDIVGWGWNTMSRRIPAYSRCWRGQCHRTSDISEALRTAQLTASETRINRHLWLSIRRMGS